MKKLLTLTALLAASALCASAEDFVVYENGSLGENINVYGWWAAGMDFQAANPDNSESKVFSFKADNGGADASMGLLLAGEPTTGPLNSATLDFNWYATGTGECHIRVTATGGKEQDYIFNVTEENAGKWNAVSLPVASTFPNVSAQWKDYQGKGEGYIFGVVLTKASDLTIYFDNVRYTDLDASWEKPYTPELIPPTSVPAIAQNQEDVISVLSAYGIHNFAIGGWGQSTKAELVTIDGVQVEKISSFNYLGWELSPSIDATGYTYMHVDFYPCEATDFGFTPISPGKEKVWAAPTPVVNEWNSYDVALSEFPIDLNNIFQIKFDKGNFAEGYIANVYFYKKDNGDDPVTPVVPGEGQVYVGTLSNSYTQTMSETDVKEYPYTLQYSVTYNDNNTLTVKADYIWTSGEPVGIIPGSAFINNQLNDFTMEGSSRVLTTTDTYDADQQISIQFYIPVANGVLNDTITYTVGSSNTSGTMAIDTENGEAVYYNLHGVHIANPEAGLYIRVLNGKASKVILK